MKRLPQWQIDSLRYQHQNAKHMSERIHKDCQVRDETEPHGYRLLTGDEFRGITECPSMMMPRSDTAYRLAQSIVHSRIRANRDLNELRTEMPEMFERGSRGIEHGWQEEVLRACEDAIAHQDRLIEHLQRLIADDLQ